MENSQFVISVVIFLITSALLIGTGLRKQPGIGIIGAVVIIALTLWFRGDNLSAIGFSRPDNWITTIFLGLVYGVLIQLLSVILIEPISEKITQTKHDHSIVENVKGNWKALVQWLLIVWILVAFLEEIIYRGFLMTEMVNIVGDGLGGNIVNVIVSSVVFGLSHGYQNRSGILSTGVIGGILAIIFIMNGNNLWLPILTHGFIDTVGIGLIAIEGDKAIQKMIWKEENDGINVDS